MLRSLCLNSASPPPKNEHLPQSFHSRPTEELGGLIFLDTINKVHCTHKMNERMKQGSFVLGSLIPPIPDSRSSSGSCSLPLPSAQRLYQSPLPGGEGQGQPVVAEPEVIPISKSRAASQQAPYGGLDQSSSEQSGHPQPSKGAPAWDNSSLSSPLKVTVQMSSERARKELVSL